MLYDPAISIFDEIEGCLRSQRYYAAVLLALTVPDVCAALESPNGQSTGIQYKEWYNRHLAVRFRYLTANDCWCLRCGIVHQGRMGHPGSQYARVLFTLPDVDRNIFHMNIMNDVLNLDAERFCRDVGAAARDWLNSKAGDKTVQENLEYLVRFRPHGLAPHMIGMPLIS